MLLPARKRPPLIINYASRRLCGCSRCGAKNLGLRSDPRRVHALRRCGEMADATDLKSVLAKSEVWVRIPSSAPLKSQFAREKSGKLTNLRLRTVPQRKARKRSLFDKYSPSVDSGSLEWRRVGAF